MVLTRSPEQEIMAAGNPLNNELRREILSVDGVADVLATRRFLHGKFRTSELSNQMSRKRENSILRSVGLTGKQLCRMSITEGMCYALFAALTVVILWLPISMAVCAEVSKKSFAGAVVPYHFPFLQMGLFLLVLFGMEVVLSVWMVRRQKKQSLVEQMRAQS